MNSDENKTFGVVLRTPVENSKGIPHILEHSVLCGSRKYPIKVPSMIAHMLYELLWPSRGHKLHRGLRRAFLRRPTCSWPAALPHIWHPLNAVFLCAGAIRGAHERLPQHLLKCVHIPGPHLLPRRVLQPAGWARLCFAQPLAKKLCCLLQAFALPFSGCAMDTTLLLVLPAHSC